MEEKLTALQDYLKKLGSVAIAFSGGVDSTFLLKVAHDTLGDNCVAVTASSPSFPGREQSEAEEFCKKEGIRQIRFASHEMDLEEYASNPPDRCYHCKKLLFTAMLDAAKAEGIPYVAEGSNMDDNGDYRPGLRAIAELGILSPLRKVGFYKSEIRALSKEMGLPTWAKQSFSCLASRFAYGERITPERLHMVEQAEEVLGALQLQQYRVRIHGDLARIEVFPDDFGLILDHGQEIRNEFQKAGFRYVTLDLQGYRTGSMNEALPREELARGIQNTDN